MVILVLSCDKNTDLFQPFYHCIEKYWVNHPEVIYKTETIQNPYYRTLCAGYPMDKWTVGVREVLQQIQDTQILLMMDDCFIRDYVDTNRLRYLENQLNGNIACFNFEKAFADTDEETTVIGFKRRKHGERWEVSLMCGLWDRDKLLTVLSEDCSPWDIETKRNNYGFDFYINSAGYIIDWGYRYGKPVGIMKGKWSREIVPFFEREGITVDYSVRGFYEI